MGSQSVSVGSAAAADEDSKRKRPGEAGISPSLQEPIGRQTQSCLDIGIRHCAYIVH